MKRIFRYAREEHTKDGEITASGPLGVAITNALNKALAKTDPETGEKHPEGGATDKLAWDRPALESEQQEASVIQELIDAVNESPDSTVQQGVDIYAVVADDVQPEDVVEVINSFQDNPREVVVIADATAPDVMDGSGKPSLKQVQISGDARTLEALREFEAQVAPAEADDAQLHEWFERVDGVAKEAYMEGFVLDFSIDRRAVAQNKSRTALEALQRAAWAQGGRFFYSLEDYVVALQHPEQPDLGRSLETVPAPGQAQVLVDSRVAAGTAPVCADPALESWLSRTRP